MEMVALEVITQERATLRAGGQDGVVAFKAAPFGEMVCYVEGRGGRGCIFVVDEGNNFDL